MSDKKAFVTGFAMIPVLVKIPIGVNEGDTDSDLMQQAKQCCEALPGFVKGYIVPGTEDEDAAHSFEPSAVEYVDG